MGTLSSQLLDVGEVVQAGLGKALPLTTFFIQPGLNSDLRGHCSTVISRVLLLTIFLQTSEGPERLRSKVRASQQLAALALSTQIL